MLTAAWAALLSAALLAADATPGVSATASKTDVGLGETFFVELKATGPTGTEWTFPAEAGDETLELRSPSTKPVASPPEPGTYRYEATAFALRETNVPPVTVKYRLPDGTAGEAATQPIPLRVASVLSKDPKEQKLADIRGPLGLTIGRAFWVAVGLFLAAIGALVFWLVRRRRKAEVAVSAMPEVAPGAEALAALDRLAAAGMGEQRPFYIALTGIAKRYLERRLDAPILEMTSAETLACLREHPHGHGIVSLVRDLAGVADQIKFAAGSAQAEEAKRHLEAVRQMVGQVEARLQAAAAVASETPSASSNRRQVA